MKWFPPVFLVLAALIPCPAPAQQSAWPGGMEQAKHVREKGEKQLSRFRQWKAHLEQWGLDPDDRHALSLGARLHTNGWSGGITYLRREHAGSRILWQLYFAEQKHEKENKLQQETPYAGLERGRPYIFGKINNVYTLQLRYGREQLLFPALLEGNLSLGLRYSAGPALALLKPYYLSLVYVEYIPEQVDRLHTERYTEANAGRFLDPAYIHGGARWAKGLDELSLVPGLCAELAFVLEPEKPETLVKRISIGGQAAYYTRPLELMAERKAFPYQFSFFLGLSLGKRWR